MKFGDKGEIVWRLSGIEGEKGTINYWETPRFKQFERINQEPTINNLETIMFYKTIYEFCTI